MRFETIVVEQTDRIARITLGRVSSGNRIDERMASELREACDTLNREDSVWLLVITGAGEAFCLGTDPASLSVAERSRPATGLESLRVASSIAAFEQPVIAALNGDALDQGLELALACDIRIASAEVRLGLTQVESGAMPWDGGTQRLPRLVGRGRALEWVLAARVLEADEALKAGLVNEVVDGEAVSRRAQEIAFAIIEHGPIAARYLKEAVLAGMDGTLEQGLRLEADLNVILQSTDDRAEGIRSFPERRKPNYRGE